MPARQSRFSKFFSQLRSKFVRQNKEGIKQRDKPINNEQQYESQFEEQQMQEKAIQTSTKKSWELEPGEKARIQRETAKIAKTYREQEEQQSQMPVQTLQQGQDGQVLQEQQPPVQQPMMDIGGMEL